MRRVEDMNEAQLRTLFWATWRALVKMEARAEYAEQSHEEPVSQHVRDQVRRETADRLVKGYQQGVVTKAALRH